MKRYFALLGILSLCMLPLSVWAEDGVHNVTLSVYNGNLGLVRDVREFNLVVGKNSLVFENVAEKMLPETAILHGSDIQVIEQNYNYNLQTPINIVDASIGKTVKTALVDEATGKTIFDEAKIIDSRYGRSILQFNYGIEIDFPGRLIFDKLPEGLVSVPTLSAQIMTQKDGVQPLTLSYLTKGISWKVDYTAEMLSDDKLNLWGWITLNNESGADYKNATLQFVAGEVNQVNNNSGIQPRAVMLSAKTQNANMAVMGKTTALNQMPKELGSYYFYTLPFKTDVLNNQSKQLALLEKKNVTYQKEYKFVSPFYLWNGVTGGSFEKQTPDEIVQLNNDKNAGLGEVLPQGVIRFYDKQQSQNLAFLGENVFAQLAVGEKSELKLGKSFDLTAEGKVVNIQKVAPNAVEALIEIIFSNASDKSESVSFVQSFGSLWNMLEENIPAQNKTAEKAEWQVSVPARGKTTLSYKVRLSSALNQN